MVMSLSFLVVMVINMLKKYMNMWILMECSMYVFSVFGLWLYLNSFVGIEILSLNFGVDWLSFLLILLSVFISGLMVSSSYISIKFKNKNSFFFIIVSLVMLLMLYLAFLSLNVIYFYIFFEASLIPIFLLVMGWGYQPERLQAGIYMLFYTLFASLPLLIIILFNKDTFNLFIINMTSLKLDLSFSYLLTFFLIFAFLVKLPMFTTHLWLPKAHVEAPVAGSMILAGILLKLGSYGIWRVLQPVYYYFLKFSFSFLVLGLVGGLVVSFVCSVQVDLKALVAYSSVVHMGILLGGMSSLFIYGYEGALCMMLGHGLVSSGLFFLVGSLYDRTGTRSLFINKGLMILFPSLTIMWFFLAVYNISAPPSLSLLSEILLTGSILKWSTMTFFWLMMMNFMSMVYTFYMYSQTQQGKLFSSILSTYVLFMREYAVAILHILTVTFFVGSFWLF